MNNRKVSESNSFLEFYSYFDTCLFFLREWTPPRRKEVGIPLQILPHAQEQNKRSYFPRPGQSYHCGCREWNATLTQVEYVDI